MKGTDDVAVCNFAPFLNLQQKNDMMSQMRGMTYAKYMMTHSI